MRFLPARLLGLLLLLPGSLALAENLISVRTEMLPALPDGADGRGVLFAAEQPTLLRATQAWRLEGRPARWTAIPAPAPFSGVVGAIEHGTNPFLISGDRGQPGAVEVRAWRTALALPPLPERLTSVAGAVAGDALHVAGTDAAGAARLFVLTPGAPDAAWRSAAAWPSAGEARGAAAQEGAFFLVVREVAVDGLWRWSTKDGWARQGTLPGQLVDGTLRAVGQAHLLFAVHRAGGADRLATFHLVTRSFAFQGADLPGRIERGVAWRNGLLLESRDAMGAAAFVGCELDGSKQLLRPLDWVALFAYLGGIAAIGYWCYVREKKQSTASFFVGGRSIPFWAAGISLYASNSSSIGYIATTAKAYTTNWQYFLGNIVNVFALVFVALCIVPLLRRLELMSVFTYLDKRFHRSVRMAASGMCILMHLGGRMSVILFLPSLAISTVTGLDVIWSILMMGVVTIAYTALGGMKAVIWTDVAQVIVKFGGLFFALGFILWSLKGGSREFLAVAAADDKMRLVDWSFDLTKATIWCFVFLQLMETVLTFPKDQVLMQRVFATKSVKEAGRSVWIFAALVLPGSLILYLIGTGLYVYYHSFPERMNPLLPNDATLPLFIAAELPAGVTGLVLAGLFSAAMGTLSSILNSVSTLVSVDFYERLAAKPDPKTSIRIAEWVTVLAGLIGIGLAILLSRFNISSFLDVALELAGLFGGAFGGAYTLGMFTRRANWQGVLIGMGFSFVATFAVWLGKLVHPFLYLAISILFSIVVGYVASLFYPPPAPESLKGLTILREPDDARATS
ncbi:MAG: sodium:solute symporter [Opitutae bacterium]|nr:sodium:solute symporter [Opitutae bacterium]